MEFCLLSRKIWWAVESVAFDQNWGILHARIDQRFPYFLPDLWFLNCPKKWIFCNFVLTSTRNLSVLKQYTYMDLKVFITVIQKMICLIGVWATFHEILAIKTSTKSNIRSSRLCYSGLFWTRFRFLQLNHTNAYYD